MKTEDVIITFTEAAELLHVSRATVYRLAERGELKAFRLLSAWRTSEAACDEYINRQLADQAASCNHTKGV